MVEPTWFVVRKDLRGMLLPLKLCDPKPSALKDAKYKIRLDTLPDAERWLSMSLSQLLAKYQWLSARDQLPKAT